jgi:hypothetical protein
VNTQNIRCALRNINQSIRLAVAGWPATRQRLYAPRARVSKVVVDEKPGALDRFVNNTVGAVAVDAAQLYECRHGTHWLQ